jgi:hypothetical protein
MTDKVKGEVRAKRKLTDITFEHEGAHLALVHKAQGGAASGYKTLVMKSVDNRSPEFIEKASQVKVTLSLPDFLEKFFHVWGEDAELLATLFGYEPSEDESEEYSTQGFWSWYREKAMEHGAVDSWGDPITRPTSQDRKEWVEDQLQGIEILKSATLSKGSADFINSLTEEQYLNLLKDQQFIEKSFKLQEVKKDLDGESGGKPTKGVNPKQTKASKADTQENEMTQETIEKAQYDAKEVELQKALADIQKAKEEIELFKAKEKEAVEKAREAEVVAAVVDVDASAKLFKAVKDLDAEAFKDVVDVVKALTAKVDESEMFKEKGSPEEGVKVAKSAVQAELDKLLKKA